MRYYLHKQKLILYSFWQNQFFKTWVNISFNFWARKSYYIPNYCKLYEDFAELDHFALATLDPELRPRKPVHFSMLQTLPALAFQGVSLTTRLSDTSTVSLPSTTFSPHPRCPTASTWRCTTWQPKLRVTFSTSQLPGTLGVPNSSSIHTWQYRPHLIRQARSRY